MSLTSEPQGSSGFTHVTWCGNISTPGPVQIQPFPHLFTFSWMLEPGVPDVRGLAGGLRWAAPHWRSAALDCWDKSFPVSHCFFICAKRERQRCGTFCSQLNFWESFWPVLSMAWGYIEDNSLRISGCGSFLQFSFHSEQDSLQSCLNAKRNRDFKKLL